MGLNRIRKAQSKREKALGVFHKTHDELLEAESLLAAEQNEIQSSIQYLNDELSNVAQEINATQKVRAKFAALLD
jgi:hypothetical protein